MVQDDLKEDAALVRHIYLHRAFPRGNVAVAELHFADGRCFGMGATSRAKSPAPKPLPRSQGGIFEPSLDFYSERIMDTDAEYKLLSAIAEVLETDSNHGAEGMLYLYTERKPCKSCEQVLQQFSQKFPNIEVRLEWSYPYPP
ncbi:MAG: deaminase domain-containing protein [Synechocystis sp.]|nr:deaminase domain-containing protein [Synechocystis sp.]